MGLGRLEAGNGAVLLVDRVPREETVAFAVGFRAGSALEPREKRGLAHLTEHMLFRSNERYTYREIDEAFELSGGDANAYTSRDLVTIVFESLPESFPRLLEVLRWMLLGRRVVREEFEMEKSVVLQEIAEAESNPRERIYDLAFTALYGRSDLGDPIHGYRETVEALEPRDVVWFKECFFAARGAIAVLSGAVTDEMVGEALRLLEQLPEEPCMQRTPSREPPRDMREESREAQQAYLALALEVGGPDERNAAARFMLGEGATSLVFERLRSERGLVYSHGVLYDPTPWTKTLVVVLEGVDPGRLDEAREALLDTLEALNNLDPGYAEGRKRYFRFTYRASKVTPWTRALTTLYLAARGKPQTYEERLESLLSLDWTRLRPEIRAAAWAAIEPAG